MYFLIKVLPWVLFLLLILTWVPWRTIFERKWGNNPNRAKVYVESGSQIEICKGKIVTETGKGFRCRFKCYGTWQSVIVPGKYPYRYVLGSRQIRVLYGQATAAPLGGMTESDIAVSSDTLDAIFRAHIGADLAKTIFGKALNYMMVLIILGAVVFGGYYLVKQMQPSPGQTVPAPAIEQPVKPLPPIPQNRPLG